MANSAWQNKKAKTFLSLHTNGRLLILPNIWNPVGARILEAKGFPAAATASAAVSASLGFVDGEKIRFSTLIDIISRIAASVEIPVTADIEAGFASSLSELEERIAQVINSGVVGINIEDSIREGGALRSVEEQCERIATVRQVSRRKKVYLVINARVDSFLSDAIPDRKKKLADAANRAKAYAEAGADCIYPVGPGDVETVKALRSQIDSPLNILASPGAAPLSLMQDIGVNRVSFGPFIFRSCLRKFVDIAGELLKFGGYECFSKDMLSQSETNDFLIQEPE